MIELKKSLAGRALLLAALAWVSAAQSFAQESSSSGGNSGAATTGAASAQANGPGAALRDVLSAACAQNEKDFARFLTTRNQESFARMTPPARIALMKRFVLLGQPGKPSAQNGPSGRPVVHCETPEIRTEMQIGGAELRDNVAFLPLQIRDAGDSSAADVHQVTMGMVRENGEWRVLSLGLLLLDLPALEIEWDTAEIGDNERGAIAALKKIAEAIEEYRRTYARLPDALGKLAPATKGATTPDAAGLLDADLAAGAGSGYEFRYVIVGASTLGAPAKYDLAATPKTYGRTGRRSFFRDSQGSLHGADRQGGVGSEADPKVE